MDVPTGEEGAGGGGGRPIPQEKVRLASEQTGEDGRRATTEWVRQLLLAVSAGEGGSGSAGGGVVGGVGSTKSAGVSAAGTSVSGVGSGAANSSAVPAPVSIPLSGSGSGSAGGVKPSTGNSVIPRQGDDRSHSYGVYYLCAGSLLACVLIALCVHFQLHLYIYDPREL